MQTSKKNTLDVLLVRMSVIFTSLKHSLDTHIVTSDILFVNQNIIFFRQIHIKIHSIHLILILGAFIIFWNYSCCIARWVSRICIITSPTLSHFYSKLFFSITEMDNGSFWVESKSQWEFTSVLHDKIQYIKSKTVATNNAKENFTRD